MAIYQSVGTGGYDPYGLNSVYNQGYFQPTVQGAAMVPSAPTAPTAAAPRITAALPASTITPGTAPQTPGGTQWWKPYQYTGAYDPNAELAMTANSLMPYMSPIDKKYWSSWLYQQDPEKFAAYNPANNLDYGAEESPSERTGYVSGQRASDAWNFLQQNVLGGGTSNPKQIKDMGPAVPWLQRVMGLESEYAPTGGGRRTRAQEMGLQNQLGRLMSEAQSSPDLQPYQELARQFVAPSFERAPISSPVPSGSRYDILPQYQYGSYSRMNTISNPRFL